MSGCIKGPSLPHSCLDRWRFGRTTHCRTHESRLPTRLLIPTTTSPTSDHLCAMSNAKSWTIIDDTSPFIKLSDASEELHLWVLEAVATTLTPDGLSADLFGSFASFVILPHHDGKGPKHARGHIHNTTIAMASLDNRR
jgi:hypothetical protein